MGFLGNASRIDSEFVRKIPKGEKEREREREREREMEPVDDAVSLRGR